MKRNLKKNNWLLSEKLTEDIIDPVTLAPAITRVQAEKFEKRMDSPSQKSGTRGKDYANENSAR